MADEDDILAVNERFYDTFSRKDAEGMDDLWSRTMPVACIHPGWSALRGRARVLASFRGILGNPTSPKVKCTGATVHLLGEVAFVICYEELPQGRLLATNVFAREDGEWKMVHHQAGPTSQTREPSDPEPPPDPKSLN